MSKIFFFTSIIHSLRHYILPLLLFSLSSTAFAVAIPVPEKELYPQEKHQKIIRAINDLMQNFHYRRYALDDNLSEEILQIYLDSLDPGRFWFLQSDIDQFKQYKHEIDNAIYESDLNVIFEIFRTYRKRVEERGAYALKLLDNSFDFDLEEDFLFDRSEENWPRDRAELDTIWRKRVKNDYLNLYLSEKSREEIIDTLKKRYQRLVSSAQQLKSDDVFQLFANAFTTSIEPHTSYFSPRNSEDFDINMRLSLEGIGAVLRAESDYTQIVRIVPGGPAARSKLLQAEDRIVGVGQGVDGKIEDVIGWRLDDVVDLIRGPKDTMVRIQMLSKRSGYAQPGTTITLIRDEIKLEEQAAQSHLIKVNNKKIGVISIPAFYIDFAGQAQGKPDYRSTSRDVLKLLNAFEKDGGIDGLIIDLRNNGGGSLSEALSVTGLFIYEGPIVQTRDARGNVEVNLDPTSGVSYQKPLAVLVNRHSASASEIFAGAIQDYQRGIIIGEPTFGKGTVQNIFDLDRFMRNDRRLDPTTSKGVNSGKLKTTIAQFYRVSGGSNQHKGVIPDIIFPTQMSDEEYGEKALDNALQWNKINPLKYIPAGAPVAQFPQVRKQHEKRIQQDKLFQLYLQQLKLAHENSQRTIVSLQQKKRRDYKNQLEEQQYKLQNEMRQLVGLPILKKSQEDRSLSEEQRKVEQRALDVLLRESANILSDLIEPVPVQHTVSAPVTAH